LWHPGSAQRCPPRAHRAPGIALGQPLAVKLKEINSILGQAQNIAILKILLSISDETPENQEYYKKRYLVKCMKWCKKQNLPIHESIISLYPY
jgi:hypothetical protein